MKNLLIIFGSIILLGAATCGGCGDTCSASATHRTVLTSHFNNNDNPKTVTLKITGMSCAGCANSIHTALSKTDGVISDEVKYPGDIAVIKYDASKISEKEIITVIEKTGFKAEVQKEKKGKKA